MSNLMLLGAALAWGSTFVPCKIAAFSLGTFSFNGLRFLLGSLFVLAISGWRLRGLSWPEVGSGALAGLVLFAGAAFQQAGLAFTTAGKAGFITGLYVVLVPLLLALFWRQRSGWNAWIASLLATAGLFLLSAEGRFSLAPGDSLVLVSAVLYALHVILIGQWVGQMEPLRLAAMQYLACGLYSLAVGLTLECLSWAALRSVGWTILYTAVFSVVVGYTLQMLGQRDAPPAVAAVILSLESVFAALFGGWFLGERLAPVQWAGGGLMLAGMVLAQVPARWPSWSCPWSRPAYTESSVQRTPE
ncbi:MAG: DMT family transporter [Anaerolineae bacterium]|nr:DMT family transporter [Anaerolineae bacterium]